MTWSRRLQQTSLLKAATGFPVTASSYLLQMHPGNYEPAGGTSITRGPEYLRSGGSSITSSPARAGVHWAARTRRAALREGRLGQPCTPAAGGGRAAPPGLDLSLGHISTTTYEGRP